MKCPKCGHDNPEDAKSCRFCNLYFNEKNIEQSKPRAKLSKLAILSLILSVFSPLLFVVTGIPSIIIGIISYLKIKHSGGLLKGKSISIVGIILSALFMCGFILLWRLDAPPIPNDYTINDIRSAAPEYSQSYELLHSLADNSDNSSRENAIGLSGEDLNNLSEINDIFKENDLQEISQKIKEKEQDILTLWDKAKKGRDILVKLDSFPEISDKTEPNIGDIPTSSKYLKNLVHLIHLYKVYICLQSINGNHKQALNELTMLDSVLKKISLNARSIATKLVCFDGLFSNIHSSNFIINNPETPKEILLVLKQHIESLSDEHTSLRNTLIFEYLAYKNEMKKMSNEPKLKYSPFSPLKYNSTLRFIRNYFDEWIAIDENQKVNNKLKIWPSVYPNIPVNIIETIGFLDSPYYKIYNPVGYALIEIITRTLEIKKLSKISLLIYEDLLKVTLSARLGEEVNLKARAYSDEYIIDIENKKIFSPGPFTDKSEWDDITLSINPEVLGFSN
ncbi:MAG: zinc ribbon domain-containing protein [Sedimentisphaerales bacterium]|nr:zinc ribbon domain-containing protein [Sedimentisphaerales bacterium]